MRLKFKTGTDAEWAADDPVLKAGEPGWATDSRTFRIGDGVTAWSGLPALGGGSNPAPLEPREIGVDVGVPTGTVLTPTTGLPAPDAVEPYDLVHPVSLATATLVDVQVYEDRSWTETVTVNPNLGQTFLFRRCKFTQVSDNWCVEVDETNNTLDQMLPLAIFEDCEFDGTHTTGRAALAPFSWMIRCVLHNAEDAWGGPIYSVGIDSDFIGDTDGAIDPHSDGAQISGVGRTTMVRCFLSAGTADGANSAFRAGTESSAVVTVQLYYCGFDRGGDTMQLRGDAGAGDITDVQVVGCRWTGDPPKGLAGFNAAYGDEVTLSAWIDNAFGDGTAVTLTRP